MSTRYLGIEAVQAPFDMGAVDGSGRVLFSCNYTCKTVSTGQDLGREIMKKIQDAGLGTPGTDLFLGTQADIPPAGGPHTLIKETGGFAPIHPHSGSRLMRPAFQIITRGSTYQAGKDRAWAIFNLLNGLYDTTLTV